MKAIRTLLAAAALLIGGLMPILYAQNVMPQQGDKITTADGIYVVSGPNLIANASFDNGFDGWHAGNNSDLSEDNFEVIAEGGADGGAFRDCGGAVPRTRGKGRGDGA